MPGDRNVLLELSPIPGQFSYPPGSGARCGIIDWTDNGWQAIEEIVGCEMFLANLTYASAPGVCDGLIEGVFRGLLGGNALASASFSIPLPIAESEISDPSCRPPNGACSDHSECCSRSCSTFIGVCN